MSSFRIELGPEDGGGTVKITQSVSDLIKGLKYGDYSRISAYQGPDVGVHTGSLSPTLGRHGKPFGKSE